MTRSKNNSIDSQKFRRGAGAKLSSRERSFVTRYIKLEVELDRIRRNMNGGEVVPDEELVEMGIEYFLIAQKFFSKSEAGIDFAQRMIDDLESFFGPLL